MTDFIASVLFILIVFVTPATAAYYFGETKALRSGAIERGYATYCQDTGEWAWQGECDSAMSEGK